MWAPGIHIKLKTEQAILITRKSGGISIKQIPRAHWLISMVHLTPRQSVYSILWGRVCVLYSPLPQKHFSGKKHAPILRLRVLNLKAV